MNIRMSKILLVAFFLLLSPTIWAQGFSGSYAGMCKGAKVELILTADNQMISGNLRQGDYAYSISAFSEGNYWIGTATEDKSGATALAAAELKGNTLDLALTLDGNAIINISLMRVAANTATATLSVEEPSSKSNLPATAQGAVDSKLVGEWRKTSNINSGSGSNAAYFTTETRFVVQADGHFQYGASRSVGGGGDWSYDSSAWSSPQITGVLRTEGNAIFIVQANGQIVPNTQQKMGTYVVQGNGMSTISNEGVKEYWQKF